MAKKKIGKRPSRYSFILNPYTDTRLSKCPKCEKIGNYDIMGHPSEPPLHSQEKHAMDKNDYLTTERT